MRKTIVLVFTYLVASLMGCASSDLLTEETHPFNYMLDAPRFKLQISPSFHHPEEFEIPNGRPYQLIYKKYSGKGGYDWGIPTKSIISLTEAQHENLVESIDATLESVSLADDTVGFDGVTYVLESSRFQYLKLSIWTPQEDTERRNLENLLKLEKHLRRLVNHDAPDA